MTVIKHRSLGVTTEMNEIIKDKARLEFMISVMNELRLFGEFVHSYIPNMETSRQVAEDEEWRQMIDRAMEG